MAARAHHGRGLHHTQHPSAAAIDSAGWVESIAALKDSDPATQLMLGGNAHSSSGGGGGGGGSSSVHGSEPPPCALDDAHCEAPDCADSSATFDAALQHALECMAAEVSSMGEVVLQLGSPSGGWGPPRLSAAQLETVLQRLQEAAQQAGADAVILRQGEAEVTEPGGSTATCATADVLVRRRAAPDVLPLEVRVAVIGNVDSGKSTLVGVLTRSMLDDGRGLARGKVFKHSHEESTGRTSSIGQHTLCLDSSGSVLNDAQFRNTTCGDYVKRASKVVTLVDLAGHERYFRTTAFGLTGHLPDYACLLLGANMGVVGMAKEHLGVALALKVPVFFIVTKVDIAPEHVLRNTLQNLAAVLKKPGVRKRPFLVRNRDEAILAARCIATDAIAPIFLTSAVSGKGLDLVRLFYNLLPQRTRWIEAQGQAAEFIIDEVFSVPGVGTVVAGTVKRGVITPATPLLLGPDIGDGSFKAVAVKSIHYKRLPVGQVVAGQTAALALKRLKRTQVRKGMALVDPRLRPAASWTFDADVAILTHSTTIAPRYQAVIHCEIIRQAAKVIAMDTERLRSGDRACVRFRFLQRPEYVTPGSRFVFREGRTKGVGVVMAAERDALPGSGGGCGVGSGGGGSGGGANEGVRREGATVR